MSSPCANCGADFRVCIECDWYNVEWISKDEYETRLKIILNKLKVRMKDRDKDNGEEPLNAVDRGYHLAYEHLCEEIDNLLKENNIEAVVNKCMEEFTNETDA